MLFLFALPCEHGLTVLDLNKDVLTIHLVGLFAKGLRKTMRGTVWVVTLIADIATAIKVKAAATPVLPTKSGFVLFAEFGGEILEALGEVRLKAVITAPSIDVRISPAAIIGAGEGHLVRVFQSILL